MPLLLPAERDAENETREKFVAAENLFALYGRLIWAVGFHGA